MQTRVLISCEAQTVEKQQQNGTENENVFLNDMRIREQIGLCRLPSIPFSHTSLFEILGEKYAGSASVFQNNCLQHAGLFNRRQCIVPFNQAKSHTFNVKFDSAFGNTRAEMEDNFFCQNSTINVNENAFSSPRHFTNMNSEHIVERLQFNRNYLHKINDKSGACRFQNQHETSIYLYMFGEHHLLLQSEHRSICQSILHLIFSI